MGAGEDRAGGTSPGVRPGALTDLLRRMAGAPEEEQGAAWSATLRPGATVGRFELVRELGRGGFGVVWEAMDRELGRSVAFKAVRAGGKTSLREERLLKEAEAAARLQHPNIVTLFEIGRAEQGPYLVLELLRGQTLAERLSRGALPVEEALRVGVEVAKGVAHAHGQGVIHRDLKPENVFLCEDGQVKVLDFGLAHAFGQRRAEGGTSGYMAPEQAEGAPEDERTDVFALGVILFEMLSRKLPFADEKALRGTGSAPVLEVPGQPAVGELVSRMLAKKAVERPRDGGEVLAALSPLGLERAPASVVSTVRTRRWTGPRLVALLTRGALLGAATAALVVRRAPSPSSNQPTPSVAVLPFADMSPGKDQEYLSDGIAEEILSTLSRVEGLRVAGRTSSFYFKGKNAKLADIGRELNVTSVLEGGVRRDDRRIRVTATVVNVADGFHVWSRSWDRDLKDILAVESEIAHEVVEALKVRLLSGLRPTVPDPPRTTAEAHLLALAGRQAFLRGSTADWARAVEAYEMAVRVDPGLSSAWAGLAMALAYDAEDRPTLEALLAEKERALEAAHRAVTAGPGVAEAYLVRATLRGLYRYEWAEARADVEKAMSLGAAGDALATLARMLAISGRLPEAMSAAERCAELEPLSTPCILRIGFYANGMGQFERGRKAFRRVMEIAPDNSYASGFLAQTYVLEGRPQEALTQAATSRGQEGFRVQAVALAQHSLGHASDSQAAFDDLRARFSHNMPFQIAEVCAWRGDPDCAFTWLRRAAERLDNGMAMVTYSPFLRGIRGDPRYAALLKKMNLPVD